MGGLVQKVKLFGEYIPWFQTMRDKGAIAFDELGLPTPKTEAWKYTKLRDLNTDDLVIEPSNFLAEMRVTAEEACGCHHEDGGCGCHHHHGEGCCCGHHHEEGDCHCHEEGHVCECRQKLHVPFEAYVIHFEKGKMIPPFPDFPRGVEVMNLMEAVITEDAKEYLGKVADIKLHPFAALNNAYMEEGIYLCVHKNVKVDKPIVLINHTKSGEENIFFNIRNLIVLEQGAEAEFVEWYNYTGAVKSRYFANLVNEIVLGKNAKLSHYKLQDEAFKANHIALSVVKQKADSNYHNFCLQRGANIGRNEVKVLLNDENASAEVNAAYIMSGWATLDTTTDILHLSPRTYSSQLVKGVVGGEAKGVFQGKIHIAQDAVQTEGNQLHRALLLSDTAEIDVKPELEIFADDVKCSHGAASGELDENQLFYMQSRGIGREEAKQILIDAYLNEALAKVKNPEIRAWLSDYAHAPQE